MKLLMKQGAYMGYKSFKDIWEKNKVLCWSIGENGVMRNSHCILTACQKQFKTRITSYCFSSCFIISDGLHIQEYLSCTIINSINSPVCIWELTFQQRQFPDVFILLILESFCCHLGWQLIKSVKSHSSLSLALQTKHQNPQDFLLSL